MSSRIVSFAVMFVTITLASECLAYSGKLYHIGAKLERALVGLKSKRIIVGDTSIAYLERQRPDETVVLLHGFGTNKDSWLRFVRHLPGNHRLIVFDLPAHGDNTFDQNIAYDAQTMAAILTPAILAVSGSRFHLVGHSLGGWVATLIAADHPEAVVSLSLIDTAGLTPPQKSDFQLALDSGRNPLLVEKKEDFDHLLGFVFDDESVISWPEKKILAAQYIARSDIHRRIWHDLTRERDDVSIQLRQIDTPVLILWGARDRIIDKSVIPLYQELLQTEVVVIMADCGHSPVTERPRETALYFAQFLRDPLSVENFEPSTIPTTALELPNR